MARRRGALADWQGDLFLPGCYDYAAADAQRWMRRYLPQKKAEARITGDAEIAVAAVKHVEKLQERIAWAKAAYGSYQYFINQCVRFGLGEDGRYDPKKNGTAVRVCRAETRRKRKG